MKTTTIKLLQGQTVLSIEGLEKGSEKILFKLENGKTVYMLYDRECCASCAVDDIVGDLADLIGTPILVAEERTNGSEEDEEGYGSHTWTFYTLRTIKGTVDLKWYGSSNGYYSESVSIRDKESAWG